MIKKIYGISEVGEKIELDFKEFLMITETGSKLTVSTKTKDPDKSDLVMVIDCGPSVPDKIRGKGIRKSIEGLRYFRLLPGASNVFYVKVVHEEPKK